MRVLVVDDDKRMVKTTSDVLAIKGYEVVGASTGEEAIEKVKANVPDCVIMDIKMPGIGGIDAMRQMKQIAPQLTVILMSAHASDDLIHEAKHAGAYAVLPKPFDLQAVLSFLALMRKEESVLIVDDDPNFCRTVKDILERRGYRVVAEQHADKALDNMEKQYQLVVLLDLKLGAASGLDVLRQIRARYPTKPVLLATGYRQEMAASIEQGIEIGAYSCLYKPLEIDALVDTIEQISREKRQAILEGP